MSGGGPVRLEPPRDPRGRLGAQPAPRALPEGWERPMHLRLPLERPQAKPIQASRHAGGTARRCPQSMRMVGMSNIPRVLAPRILTIRIGCTLV